MQQQQQHRVRQRATASTGTAGQPTNTTSGTECKEAVASTAAARTRNGKQRKQKQQRHLGALAAPLLLLAFIAVALVASQLWPELLLLSTQQQPPSLPPPPPLPEDAHGVTRGSRLHGPSLGNYPRGCRWRSVSAAAEAEGAWPRGNATTTTNTSSHNDTVLFYEYWDTNTHTWTEEQPPTCRLAGFPDPGPPAPWRLHKGSPRTEVVPSTHAVAYRNLWYNNGRWYALVDSGRVVPGWRFSKNHEVTPLHVADARAWLAATRWRVVPGDTLLFDFTFFTHPTAIGHWWELLAPLFSVLKGLGGRAGGFARPCDQVVLLHLKRGHLMEWVRAVMAVALGMGPHQQLPSILLQQETDHPWKQLTMPLEGVAPGEWVMFDHVLIVRDLFTGGNRSFTSSADAREFRAAVYRQYGFPPPARPRPVPRVITFQRKRANRRVLNEAGLLALLGRYGEVRAVEFNATTSFAEQLAAMRGTGVFVSPHTSNLANAVFLQPGSAVVELIQRHWTWNNIDQSFRDHTRQLGDVHHYAWRANHANETAFQLPRDAARFSTWTKEECLVEDCVEAATKVDIMVDLAALQRLLDDVLPRVFRGARVRDAELPWPEAL